MIRAEVLLALAITAQGEPAAPAPLVDGSAPAVDAPDEPSARPRRLPAFDDAPPGPAATPPPPDPSPVVLDGTSAYLAAFGALAAANCCSAALCAVPYVGVPVGCPAFLAGALAVAGLAVPWMGERYASAAIAAWSGPRQATRSARRPSPPAGARAATRALFAAAPRHPGPLTCASPAHGPTTRATPVASVDGARRRELRRWPSTAARPKRGS